MKKICLYMLLILFFCSQIAALERITRDSVLNAGDVWMQNYMEYRVDESLIDTLKSKIGDDLKIVVYLGLWCKDSVNNVPLFIKIIDVIGGGKIKVDYFNVVREDKKDNKYFVPELKVERVPTFIFYRDGKETGRIIENPVKSMAEDFLDKID
jgi:hypothetical protein